MNGVHDMGGMQDMGPVHAEQNEPVFHMPWEGRVFALVGLVVLDEGAAIKGILQHASRLSKSRLAF